MVTTRLDKKLAIDNFRYCCYTKIMVILLELLLFIAICLSVLIMFLFWVELHWLIFSLTLITLIICIVSIILKKKVIFNVVFASYLSVFFAFCSVSVFSFDKTTQQEFVIHATGSLNGHSYLNSVESLEKSIKTGNLIEIDFMLTKDEGIVCTHLFENIQGFSAQNRPTYDEFKNYKIKYGEEQYTPLTFDYVLQKFKENKNFKVVFDTKEAYPNFILEKMLKKAGEHGIDLKKRMIVQVYSKESYIDLCSMNFDEYWFTNYKARYTPKKLKQYFENAKNVTTIILYAEDWEYFKMLSFKTNKKVAVHTINDPHMIDYMFNHGVDYIYTDLIYSNIILN